ncbi:rRNA pseudouridine synthase [Janthinobacterium agaricidamnosum]|uniref:Dual-specificity RNA pseudouridine synthase RluF n=1 Tax=Janthinobacterium agaricidamnosum NBRC 102515 = DSM 9628 TaxID=1349767 RepID=W0V9H4_9BURK|nr:rRNA pseudouridine synthase [Janthinobacterium agaricidamnosum]CDG83988.1 S4 domain protein [Janthinobacterium agaricidamnosum NBRC 102515 = DSM 9628]
MTDSTQDNTVRLAKRLAEQLPCSRREAELYIEGGWVSVDGVLVEEAGARVSAEQAVVLAAGAKLDEIPPVTILLHKPAGVNGAIGSEGKPALACLNQDNLLLVEHAGQRFLKRHLAGLTLTNPLDTMASGLLVFTQDFRVVRKLVDEAKIVEQEFIVEVSGAIAPDGLKLLNHGLPFNGKPLPPIKVSWQNETRLRFALKNVQPGQIVHMCGLVGLTVVAMKRLRIGRISMAALPSGQWRYLTGYERF